MTTATPHSQPHPQPMPQPQPQLAAAPRLRADAARNRAQILTAARAAFRELGTAVPLDEIARRAEVNIATLYRRFPDREALVRQVVLDGFTVLNGAARRALDTARADALKAIEQLMMDMVNERDWLILPMIGGPIIDDADAIELQRDNTARIEEILSIGRAQATIRDDATAVDVIAAGAMACRPMPHLPPEQAAAIATRHVRIFADGLRPPQPRPLLPASPTPDQLFANLRTP